MNMNASDSCYCCVGGQVCPQCCGLVLQAVVYCDAVYGQYRGLVPEVGDEAA
jgi:hypothetical protein